MPDINSLPPSSRSSPVSQQRPPPSPTTGPGGSPRLPRSPHVERRHSSLLRDLNSSDVQGGSGSGSGNSPIAQLPQPLFQQHNHHHRAPSLGEIHQELENEQEAQVNRLLAMIRQQQAQIQQLQSQTAQQSTPSQSQSDAAPASHSMSDTSSAIAASTTAIAASTPGSSRRSSTVPSRSQSQVLGTIPQSQQSNPSAPAQPLNQQQGTTASPSSLSRQSSYRRSGSRTENRSQHSHGSSPSMHPHEGAPDWGVGHFGLVNRDRDELVYYQAEAAMVQRENQMLKGRIRELERQVQELGLRTGQGDEQAQPADR